MGKSLQTTRYCAAGIAAFFVGGAPTLRRGLSRFHPKSRWNTQSAQKKSLGQIAEGLRSVVQRRRRNTEGDDELYASVIYPSTLYS
jgi:hypothetical protein